MSLGAVHAHVTGAPVYRLNLAILGSVLLVRSPGPTIIERAKAAIN